ncbi:MAG: glycosyltransferase [Planctomycetes bacterium]|nr:glycosyltransferase [Planctomycetota bacterium]
MSEALRRLRRHARGATNVSAELTASAWLSTKTWLGERLGPERLPEELPTVWFLTEGDPVKDWSPAARYRAFQYVPLLEELGFPCKVLPARPGKYWSVGPGFGRFSRRFPRLAGAWARFQYRRQRHNRRRDFARTRGKGVVFLQRDLLALSHDRTRLELPLFNRRIVFYFDDAIYRSPSWCNAPGQDAIDQELREKIEKVCALSSAVIVANSHLAEFVRPHNANVHVIPTTLDTEHFVPASQRATNPRPVIGWAGTSGNLHYLRKIGPALRRLAERRDFVLRVICNPVAMSELPDLPEGFVEFVPWNATDEVARIQGFDIGIMPLDDDDWAAGKAAFKLIQYMACGVPIVWSPTGANPEVAGDDGHCGFAAAGDDGWLHALDRLLADENLRARCGAAGRERAVRRFDRRAQVDRIAELLVEVHRRG